MSFIKWGSFIFTVWFWRIHSSHGEHSNNTMSIHSDPLMKKGEEWWGWVVMGEQVKEGKDTLGMGGQVKEKRPVRGQHSDPHLRSQEEFGVMGKEVKGRTHTYYQVMGQCLM